MSTTRKSRLLHEKILSKIVNAPINLYFDKVPSGIILNRFSGDIGKMDTDIGSYVLLFK